MKQITKINPDPGPSTYEIVNKDSDDIYPIGQGGEEVVEVVLVGSVLRKMLNLNS